MRRPLPLLIAATLVWPAAVLATGFGGDAPPTRIPVPAKVFGATVDDRAGSSVTLTRVTLNGEVVFYGVVGEGQVAVPFERIANVRVEPTDDPAKVVAFATLRDGTTVRLVAEHDVPLYGDAAYGHYKIELEKVRRVVFAEP